MMINWCAWALTADHACGRGSLPKFLLFLTLIGFMRLVNAQDQELFDSPGQDTFEVPDRVTELVIEVWGAGGAGGEVTERGASGGGGGGAYARTLVAVAPGDDLTVRVGAGGTPQTGGGNSWVIHDAEFVALAEAGANAGSDDENGARGGRAGQSVGNEVRYSGGRGADGVVRGFFGRLQGGGGGSSAGVAADGENGDDDDGGTAPAGGGDGGNGSDTAGVGSSSGAPGDSPGGGGGGATTRALFGGDFPGGTGGDGQVIITYEQGDAPAIHHFEIGHDGVGLTCQPSEGVVIRACANANCSQQYVDPVSVTMSPSGWVGGDTFTFSGGETVAALRQTSPATVTLDVSDSTPETGSPGTTLCRSGNSGLSAANCDLRFYDTGLVFDVPDMVANELETGIPVRAVRTEGSPEQACVPAFENVTRDVDFWSAYISPDDSGVSATPPVAVNGDAVSGSSASPTSIPLSFDGNGVATIDVNYPDAGRMQLSAAYQGSAANNDQGLTMPGADQFVSRPFGFCIEATSPNAACGSPLSDCSVLATAGDPFDLEIRAVASESGGNGNLCAGNATTRNFRATLEMDHALVAPSDGVPGVLGETEAVFAQADAGEITVQQSVSEVGVFSFSIPVGQPYLATSLPGAQSADTGRFIPARFEVTTGALDPGELEAGCTIGGADDIHYVGQPMDWAMPPSVPLVALNRQGVVTENYTRGGFLKLTGSDVQRLFPTSDEAQTISGGTLLLPAEFDAQDGDIQTDNTSTPGLMDYVFSSDDVFWYPKTREALVAPFPPALAFELTSIEDSDGVQALSLPDPFTAGLATDPETGNTFDVRYGRLAMENVYGPENLDELLMPVTLEAWNGTSWQPHEAGSCLPSDLTAVSDASETTSDHHSLDTSGLQLGSVSGEYFLRLVPDGSQGTDTIHWPLSSGVGSGQPPAEHDWLMDFWGRDPDPDELQNPQGLATFGVYRGHDRIIYWREVEN